MLRSAHQYRFRINNSYSIQVCTPVAIFIYMVHFQIGHKIYIGLLFYKIQ